VNLVEGTIRDDEKDHITIASPALETLAYVGHGVTGFEGQAVVLALRPEKLRVDKDEPAQPYNKVRGTIEDIAYFGSHSVYHVRLAGGTRMLANMANSQRWASERFTWNDAVWLSWDDAAGVVLTS
jgi:putrescine transport system ATP-binding protein